jgi:hypothetical protein
MQEKSSGGSKTLIRKQGETHLTIHYAEKRRRTKRGFTESIMLRHMGSYTVESSQLVGQKGPGLEKSNKMPARVRVELTEDTRPSIRERVDGILADLSYSDSEDSGSEDSSSRSEGSDDEESTNAVMRGIAIPTGRAQDEDVELHSTVKFSHGCSCFGVLFLVVSFLVLSGALALYLLLNQ